MYPKSMAWLVLAAAAVVSAGAHAQGQGGRPLRLIVGFPPGGAVDITARIIAPALSELLGGQVVIDNRGGANGIIGAELVAKAAPDGQTFGLVSISSIVLNVHLYSKISYHTLRDFTPISRVAMVPFVIAINPGIGAGSLKELIATARAQPGKLVFGSPGMGSLQHLTIEMLNAAAKIDIRHVPYKGTGPAVTDVLGGHISGLVSGASGVIGPVKSGKMRIVAATGEQRTPALPDVPTVLEQGLPKFVVVTWYAIFAPPKMPQATAAALHAAVAKAVATPAIQEKLIAAGLDPKTDSNPAAFARFVADDFARYGELVKQLGVKVE